MLTCTQVPAIITNYSGPATFVNEENGYPIKVSHVRRNGQAEPDLNDVQRLMKHVYENPQAARRKGFQCVSVLLFWNLVAGASKCTELLSPGLIYRPASTHALHIHCSLLFFVFIFCFLF